MSHYSPIESVANFLDTVQNPTRRHDAEHLIGLMRKITGQPPAMWGSSIIGFGKYHYKYESGREGDMAAISFSPRAANSTIYLVDGISNYEEQLKKLGPHSTGKACLYIKDLGQVDLKVLEEILLKSYDYIKGHDGNMHRAL